MRLESVVDSLINLDARETWEVRYIRIKTAAIDGGRLANQRFAELMQLKKIKAKNGMKIVDVPNCNIAN